MSTWRLFFDAAPPCQRQAWGLLLTAAAACVAMMTAAPAASQTQNKLRLIVAGPPGGAVDVAARLAGDHLNDQGYLAIVENFAGAGGQIAAEALRKSPADGSTVLITPPGVFTIYPHIYPKLPYSASDFSGVATLAGYQFALVVGPATPAQTMPAFLEWARQNPDKASYGSPGAGSEPHFIGTEIDGLTNTRLTHVPYRGGAQAINDLAGAHLPAMITALPNVVIQHNAGKVKALAMTGERRSDFLPDVPTMAEVGLPDLTGNLFYGAYVLSDVPPETQAALAKAFAEVSRTPAYREGLKSMSLDPLTMSREELAATMNTMSQKWAKVVERSGFTVDQ
ncbi:MAG: Bug family tripartite tricarboxylate transporter substrate binding protein [Pigmentiphaga sp.]